MPRLLHAALGAALALTAACAQKADSAGNADSAMPVAATPLTGDSAAPAAAAPPAASDSATASATTAPADSASSSARSAPPTSTRPAAATARSTAPVTAGTVATPKLTGRGAAAAMARSTSPIAAAPTAGASGETTPSSNGSAQDESVKVNQFMTYNPAAKTVHLQVTAALTSQRGGFNFNGGSDGSQTITVPQGWTVRMHVRNVDAIPHSAILILDEKPLPNAPETPAISRAYTSHVSDGLPAQTGEDDVEFRASKVGNFLIYCGVPGHGPSGMYIKFVVAADATKPSYSM